MKVKLKIESKKHKMHYFTVGLFEWRCEQWTSWKTVIENERKEVQKDGLL